ncbi:hypothetical protein GBAR_LOCUS10425 [Geodia barretti]|uniref:Uncharacterized protein n=1 Tax=Geodia barretti TaxID=519541 RepID=A0AA35RVH7_GEOBA|nr:hypothetical protein GBAR_LOCUS10425 [Geodia barretti]
MRRKIYCLIHNYRECVYVSDSIPTLPRPTHSQTPVIDEGYQKCCN